MKKISLLLIMLVVPTIYACVPQAYLIPEILKSKIIISGDFNGADSLEVTVQDTNCVSTKPCNKETFTISPNSSNNFISVIPGNKSITVVKLKDGKVIGQTTYNETAGSDKSVIITVSAMPSSSNTAIPSGVVSSPTENPSSSVATPIALPSSTSSSTASPVNNTSPSPNVTVSPTPSANSNSSNSGGGFGGFPSSGGGSAPTNPPIQVSATVIPDNTSVN